MALGAFRAQTKQWIASARELDQLAQQLDLAGQDDLDEVDSELREGPSSELVAERVVAELVPELHALLTQVVGIRHLVLLALGSG